MSATLREIHYRRLYDDILEFHSLDWLLWMREKLERTAQIRALAPSGEGCGQRDEDDGSRRNEDKEEEDSDKGSSGDENTEGLDCSRRKRADRKMVVTSAREGAHLDRDCRFFTRPCLKTASLRHARPRLTTDLFLLKPRCSTQRRSTSKRASP